MAQWIDVPGWLDRRTHEFPRPVGQRLFGACDVPDLALLPRRYPGVKTMNFHAGFASDTGHKLVELLARQVQAGRLESALPFAKLFYWVAQRVQPLLSDSGGMYVKLEGLDTDGEPHQLTWTSAGQRESRAARSLRPGDRTDAQDRRGLRAAGGSAGLHGTAVGRRNPRRAQGTQDPADPALSVDRVLTAPRPQPPATLKALQAARRTERGSRRERIAARNSPSRPRAPRAANPA